MIFRCITSVLLAFCCLAYSGAAAVSAAAPAAPLINVTAISVEWDKSAKLAPEINPESICLRVKETTELYLKTFGLIRLNPETSAQSATMHITLGRTSKKQGGKPLVENFLGVATLDGIVTLAEPNGSLLRTVDISSLKTRLVVAGQVSGDGSVADWLCLNFTRQIVEKLNPEPATKTPSHLQIDSPLAEGMARIVYVHVGSKLAVGFRPRVLLDGVVFGRVSGNHGLIFDVPAGKHTIAVIWNGGFSGSLAYPPIVKDFEAQAKSTNCFSYTDTTLADKTDYVHGTRTTTMVQKLELLDESATKTLLPTITFSVDKSIE